MSSIASFASTHHSAIIYTQLGVIVLLLLACTFNGVVPVCHWLFDCDHAVVH
jgi:hypothetical protein